MTWSLTSKHEEVSRSLSSYWHHRPYWFTLIQIGLDFISGCFCLWGGSCVISQNAQWWWKTSWTCFSNTIESRAALLSIKRFHQYLYDRHFTSVVVPDHLESLLLEYFRDSPVNIHQIKTHAHRNRILSHVYRFVMEGWPVTHEEDRILSRVYRFDMEGWLVTHEEEDKFTLFSSRKTELFITNAVRQQS